MRYRSEQQGGRQGVTLVEMAFVLLPCLLFLLVLFEYGRLTMLRHLVDDAAREGARAAIAGSDRLATSDIQTTVTNYLAGQPITLTSFNVYKADPDSGNSIGTWTDAAFGDAVAVDVQASYQPIFPGLTLPNPVVLKAKVLMRSEAN